MIAVLIFYFFFFFNDTATTEIYTLSLHDALPIFQHRMFALCRNPVDHHVSIMPFMHHHVFTVDHRSFPTFVDRKSTRLNSSHGYISYAVFCLKKKKTMHIVYGVLRFNTSLTMPRL